MNNDLYESNQAQTAIFSKDGSELFGVVREIEFFEIPDGVRVIKKSAFEYSSIKRRIFIPASVEVIESNAFHESSKLKTIEFEEGSRLTKIGYGGISLYSKVILINIEAHICRNK